MATPGHVHSLGGRSRLAVLRLLLDLVPVDQLDRRRARRGEARPLAASRPCRRASDLDRAGAELLLLAALGLDDQLVDRPPTSTPPRQTSSSSSLMPITPLPTPARMLTSSTREVDHVAVARREDHARLVADQLHQHDPVALVELDVPPADLRRRGAERGQRRPQHVAAARSRPAGTARRACRPSPRLVGRGEPRVGRHRGDDLHLVAQLKNFAIGSP